MKKTITFLALCAMLSAFCSSAGAQQTGKIFRIGFLGNSTASVSAVRLEAFWQEMTQTWVDRGKEYYYRISVCRGEK